MKCALLAFSCASAVTAQGTEHDPFDRARAIIEANYSYLEHRTGRGELDLPALLDEARAIAADHPGRRGLLLGMLRVAAGLCDGHGAMIATDRSAALGDRGLPFTLVDVAEGLMIDGIANGVTELERGDILTHVDARPIQVVLAERERFTCASTATSRRAHAIASLSTSGEGDTVRVTWQRDGKEMRAELERVGPARRAKPARTLPIDHSLGDVGDEVFLYRPGPFSPPDWAAWAKANPDERDAMVAELHQQIAAVFTYAQKWKAMVLDLRDNPGGTDLLGQAVARHLIPEGSKYFGLSARRDGEFRPAHFYTPDAGLGEPKFKGPLAILTNAKTFSVASNLVACLRDTHADCITVGRQDGAGTGAPRAFDVGDGIRLRFCTQRVLRPSGTLIEGIGVSPDVPVQWTASDWIAGRDPDMDAAITALKEKLK